MKLEKWLTKASILKPLGFDEEDLERPLTSRGYRLLHKIPRLPMPVIERLDEAGRKPAELVADAGYGSGENIVEASQREVELVAPITSGTPPDANKMQLSDFETTADYSQVLSCIK